ncbi:YciI family protein [Hoyosella subflava]|uniref:YCII-like protein n=1 Tax=Hoyosella subflava (strain DSM 45089 / JCM 17490 / NBRC 109087 / DQS3-9A1) TaxID=443218 RepID=F6EKK4_HOYSD|nr:YciI family protein [Hoyosella subflava]AEF40140.1 YCII-like protein [Hoyosella subflava DQS3-9A1]
MRMFAVEYTYSGEDADARLAARPDHRSWLSGLVSTGVVVSAGAFADGTGALILVAADKIGDVDALRKLLADDPFATGGFIHGVQIREWSPVLGALSD